MEREICDNANLRRVCANARILFAGRGYTKVRNNKIVHREVLSTPRTVQTAKRAGKGISKVENFVDGDADANAYREEMKNYQSTAVSAR